MSELAQNSKHSNNLEDLVLKKISDLVTRFHSILLPKANNSGVYRDLSQQQQYMLTTLDTESTLHSILAGSLAVDSCLANILRFDTIQNQCIMKLIPTVLNSYGNLQTQVNKTNWNLNKLMNSFGDHLRNLIKEVQKLVLSEESSEKSKQTKKQQQSEIDQSSLVTDLNIENIKLKEQLIEAEKQQVSLELRIMKMLQNANSDDNHHFKQQLESQKQIIKRMRQQKNELLTQIQKMEEEIKILSKYNDRNANYLLQELQYEVECLKEQKKHDERIMSEITMKIDMMCISRNRNRISVDGSIRSDYVQRNNYTPTRSRVRENYQRPPSHLKKNSMIRKSNIFEYMDESKQVKNSMQIPIHKTQNTTNELYNDSFMPRYSPRQMKIGSTKNKKIEFFKGKEEGKTLNRIKTNYL